MPFIELPCIRRIRLKGDAGVSVTFAVMPGEDGATGVAIYITPPDSPVTVGIVPYFPYIISIPNFEVIFGDLFGKSTIQTQKDAIQNYFTQSFRFVADKYGFPLREGRALQFKSSGVQRLLQSRPDLAAEVQQMLPEADLIVTGAFGYDQSGPGIRERMVNQYLANAAYNQWPFRAAMDLWQGLIGASTCLPGTFGNPPPPPPPPPPRVPGQQYSCPPGWTEQKCQEACGQIRQLTAAQLPLGPELTRWLSYFEDCILPPDGSWSYQAPPLGIAYDETGSPLFSWLPEGTKVGWIPYEYWPYKWDQSYGGKVWQVTEAPDGSRWPARTLIPATLDPGDMVVLPDGTVECWGNQLPPVDTEPEPPPEEPPPLQPPPQIPDWAVQLRQDLDGLRADFDQFRSIVPLQIDSLKQAVWDSFCRSNMQAAEVYAADQPGWQGPRPAPQCTPMPPGWQTLPTPGNPQVLEIPPIQQFPQAPAPQPVDLAPLEQRVYTVEQKEGQLQGDFDNLLTELPDDIQRLIDRYDREVEKPDLQKLRDDCCQPNEPPPQPEPIDICKEGLEKWGIWAECWLDANTPATQERGIAAEDGDPLGVVGFLQDAVDEDSQNARAIALMADIFTTIAAANEEEDTDGLPVTLGSARLGYVFQPRPAV